MRRLVKRERTVIRSGVQPGRAEIRAGYGMGIGCNGSFGAAVNTLSPNKAMQSGETTFAIGPAHNGPWVVLGADGI